MLDLTLTDSTGFTTFTIFTGRDDNTVECCDEPAADAPLLSIAEPFSPEYICHLSCYLADAHARNTAD